MKYFRLRISMGVRKILYNIRDKPELDFQSRNIAEEKNLKNKKENHMKEIFEQYGSVIIAAIAISSLVAIVVLLMSTEGQGGAVTKAFNDLIKGFLDQASGSITP